MLTPEIRQDRADSRTIREQQEIPGVGALAADRSADSFRGPGEVRIQEQGGRLTRAIRACISSQSTMCAS